MGPGVAWLGGEGAPHIDVQQEAEGKKVGDQGRSAIAQQGQGKPGDRKQADGHTDVEDNVKRHGADDAEDHENSKAVDRSKSDVQSLEDEDQIQNEKDRHADESHFLRQN